MRHCLVYDNSISSWANKQIIVVLFLKPKLEKLYADDLVTVLLAVVGTLMFVDVRVT